MSWLVSQYGAREYYAIPRALKKARKEFQLITDIWAPPSHLLHKFVKSRYHTELKSENIAHFNKSFIINGIKTKILGKSNDFSQNFDEKVSRYLLSNDAHSHSVFFSYSYTCNRSFKTAKKLGLKTILGQINPGPQEAKIVEKLYQEYEGGKYKPNNPDQKYWDRWYEEVDHSDSIMVNSLWTESLLKKEGISPKKIKVVPLAYAPAYKNAPIKSYPVSFNHQRPLRILYLGAVSIRKGFHVLKETMNKLLKYPVELWVVGNLKGPSDLLEKLPGNIIYKGNASHDEAHAFYKNSDVFILPTFSDGFAITQLEAQHHHLPLIVSPHCAQVVIDKKNGWLLKGVSEEEIRESILYFVDQPEKLLNFSLNSIDPLKYSIENLGRDLLEME